MQSAHLAFACAMPMELSPLVRKLSLTKKQLGDLTVHAGTLGDRDVVAVVTGIGTQLATQATRRLLDTIAVERVVVVGTAGAVDAVTPIGTLVLPEVVVDGATGTQRRPHPLGRGTPRGKMWTSDALVTDSDALDALRADGVVALDMETAAIAALCEERGLPWHVFRAVSDRATDGSLDDEILRLFNQDGTPEAKAVLRYVARHPARVPHLVRLARNAKRAAAAAAEGAISACSAS